MLVIGSRLIRRAGPGGMRTSFSVRLASPPNGVMSVTPRIGKS